ncbi:DUF1642 domain-containing protein [Enterococcus sp. C50]|uniref:DUF1642 domain-containing protein n=1 Tax=Enterococcus sp. C50 TaxID=3231311 RepID=UPI0034A0272F
MNKQELIEELEKLKFENTDEASGKSACYNKAIEAGIFLAKQLDETKKIIFKQHEKFVVEWLQSHKCSFDLIELYSEIEYATDSDGFISDKWCYPSVFYDWLSWDTDKLFILADAMRYGYEVEKEPLYYVKMPFRAWDEESAELKTEFLYLGYDITSDETMFFPTSESRKVFEKDFKTKLDEATIKSADEKYWAFAVQVDEVEG